jgi:uncharacterized protein
MGMKDILLFAMSDVEIFRWKMAIVSATVALLVDVYLFRILLFLLSKKSLAVKIIVYGSHWLICAAIMGSVFLSRIMDPLNDYSIAREWISGILLVIYASKISGVFILCIDDIRRALTWLRRRLSRKETVVNPSTPKITRSDFLMKSALVVSAVPFATLSFGILYGAHDYRLNKRIIRLPHLPKAWDGVRIGHLSDIHTGTLFNKLAVQGGVDMLMKEKPDLIFFTGDLVDYYVREINPYFDIFSRLKAPLGVFSTTGNHDYGDYNWWPSDEAKQAEFENLKLAHQRLGYQLLLNENKILTIDNEPLAIIGVENWSLHKHKRYGKIDVAAKLSEEVPVKLLLSHDPSHWDAEVRTKHPDIDVTFSGHTHGFQAGIQVGDFKWSPSQYLFKQWADLYTAGNQYLYVNRGFGSLGYPGRIGMPPELTVIELKRG